MVPKADGTWRPCGDYRRLNLVTTPDSYPLPNIQDCTAKLHGCTVFSKIDLLKGYHQIPIAAADIPKTAIITPFGSFEYFFMPQLGPDIPTQNRQHLQGPRIRLWLR